MDSDETKTNSEAWRPAQIRLRETLAAVNSSADMLCVFELLNEYLGPLLARSAPLRAIPAPFPVWGVQDVAEWLHETELAAPALGSEPELRNVVLALKSAALRLHHLSRAT